MPTVLRAKKGVGWYKKKRSVGQLSNLVCGESTVLPCGDLAVAIKAIAKAVPIVGFSNKIRDGKVRVYVEKVPSPAVTAPLKTLTIAGREFEVEFFAMGKVKPLSE